jgi:RimJ/RimL family protein N-acetyltransferase
MSEAVNLRLIREDDIPAFHRLLDSVAREKKYLASVEAPPIERMREFVLGNIREGYAQYVAECDGELVGWADIVPGQRTSTQHMGGLGMGVADGFRGRGIGRMLLSRAIEHCWEMGLKRIELEVFVNNARAITLYEHMGFQHEGRLRKARLIDGEYQDVLHMALLHPDFEGDHG